MTWDRNTQNGMAEGTDAAYARHIGAEDENGNSTEAEEERLYGEFQESVKACFTDKAKRSEIFSECEDFAEALSNALEPEYCQGQRWKDLKYVGRVLAMTAGWSVRFTPRNEYLHPVEYYIDDKLIEWVAGWLLDRFVGLGK